MSDVKQMPDAIQTRRIVAIGVLALIAFSVGIWWAIEIQRSVAGTIVSDTAKPPAYAGKQEVGMVYQPLFTSQPLAAPLSEDGRKELESLGWADPDHKYLRIPIERAMKLIVERGKL
jgi:hypothetical protein